MITSFLWIFIPLLLGIVMLFFQKRNTITLVLGIFLSLTLMMMALILPISNVAMVGSQPFPLSDQINFAGLQIQFSNANRPFIIFFYGYLAFLYCGIPAARTQRNFVPVSLIITTFVITGISIKPAIFGIIFYQPAVLLCAFLLAPPFTKLNKGVLRFLIFQVMGMAFLLLAGWSISGGPESIENAAALSRALLIFWISFSFLFAIFPLHTWVTLVAENANPFLALFVFTSLFGGYTFTLLSIIDSYDWFFGGERISEILRICGFLLVITGGTGAVFQRNLGRLFGYAIIMEVGFCLSAIAVNNDDLIMMQLPRLFILSLWAMGLSILRTHSQDLAMESVKGLGRQFPFASSAIILSQLALA